MTATTEDRIAALKVCAAQWPNVDIRLTDALLAGLPQAGRHERFARLVAEVKTGSPRAHQAACTLVAMSEIGVRVGLKAVGQ